MTITVSRADRLVLARALGIAIVAARWVEERAGDCVEVGLLEPPVAEFLRLLAVFDSGEAIAIPPRAVPPASLARRDAAAAPGAAIGAATEKTRP